jgi:hypothetical protein
MSLPNRTLRAAEALKAADDAATRTAARLTPLEKPVEAPDEAESDLAHALRTRRMLRKPLSTTR